MTQPSFTTHEVFNQSPPFEDVNLYSCDQPLVAAVAANGGADAQQDLIDFGQLWGSAEMAERGRLANESTPKLRTYDAKGFRRDVVEFHPAYHALMAQSVQAGLHNSTWTQEGRPRGGSSEVVRAAKFYIATQVESGHLCPVTMTRASVAALAAQPELLATDDACDREPRLRSDICALVAEARHDARHGHDREAGRHRCARQHDPRGAHRRRIPDHRPQMVHVGADVRCLPGTGAG